MKINKQVLFLFKKIIKDFYKMVFYTMISFFIKRDNNIWVIGGGHGDRFTDNSKHLFLYLNHHSIKRAIWITKRKSIRKMIRGYGYESYLYNEIKGIYYALKAKVHIVDITEDSLNPYTSGSALKFILWHGLPMKRIGEYERDLKKKKRNPLNTIKTKILYFLEKKNLLFIYESFKPGFWYGNHIYFLATSQLTKEIFSKAYRIPKKHIIIANYPRNEILLPNNSENYFHSEEEISIKTKIDKLRNRGYTIIGYFPTFRRDDEGEIFLGLYKKNEVKAFFTYLLKQKCVLVIKNHAGSKKNDKNNPWKFNKSGKKFSNLIEIQRLLDLNPILPSCDILITDYSGVAYDYLWLERPIIFYPFDYSSYIKKRGLIFNYQQITPGRKVSTIQKLKEVLEEYLRDKGKFTNEYKKERIKIKNQFFSKKTSGKIIEKTFDNILK